MGLLLTLLDFIPIVNTVTDLVSLAGLGDGPSVGGGMAKLASTVMAMHFIAPYLERFSDWTNTKVDDKAYDWFVRGLGLIQIF